jgi:membrane associated rhomboid family serine protease
MLPVTSHEARTARWPYVTICLIGLNVLVFLFEVSLGDRFVPFLQDWGLVPARVNAGVTAHNVVTVGTSVFLHAGVVHLIVNMWFLYVFGDAVEDALGPWWFLALYLLCGFFGGMAFVAMHADSALPAVGASGAISGVMGASLVLWPRAHLRVPGLLLIAVCCLFVFSAVFGAGVDVVWIVVLLAVLVVSLTVIVLKLSDGVVDGMLVGLKVPAWTVLGIYFGLQLFNGILVMVDPAYGGSVGWWAHIGGFVSGALFAAVSPAAPVRLPGEAARS